MHVVEQENIGGNEARLEYPPMIGNHIGSLCSSWSSLAVDISKERDTPVGTIYSFHRPLAAQRITSHRVLSKGTSKDITVGCDKENPQKPQ